MTIEHPVTDSTTNWTLLEQDQRFSRSVLWTIQKAYYNQKGPIAWYGGEIPYYATCNTYIAQTYAEVVMAYLRELARTGQLAAGEPVYIVELGAGMGAFAAYFLHKLGELKQESSLRHLDVRYVMTDFTPTNLKGWSEHPHLRPLVASGVLDFGKFDVDTDDTIQLVSGGALTAGGCKNPVVVLANYVLDSFRQDIFRVENGEIHEVRVSTRAPGSDPTDLGQAGLLTKLQTQYSHEVVDETRYYQDPIWNELLAEYRSQLADTTFTIPVSGLVAIERLLALSGGRGMLLSSDKGFTHVDELHQRREQSMQLHTGCFSMMVNYHAIGRYFTRRGGAYAATSRRHMTLKTAMCLIGGESDDFVDTLSAFRCRIEDFGPGDFFDLLRAERTTEKSIEHVLGLLRLSGYDPRVLFDFAELVRSRCKGIPESLNVELRLAIDRVWSQYYATPQNLPFELGRIMLALGRPQEAARFNQIAIEWFGEVPAAYLNMGICYYYAEDPNEALRCFERAKQLNPDFGIPREWIARIHAERARGGPARELSCRAPAAHSAVGSSESRVADASEGGASSNDSVSEAASS